MEGRTARDDGGMRYETKRSLAMTPEEVQRGNRSWWSSNPMTYDWHGEVQLPRLSLEWFDEIDRRFVQSARLYATEQKPFDRILPFERLAGRRVLEIGCGMGLHTELLVRAGARVTAIDLADTSVAATRRRLELKGLSAHVERQDAEQLAFDTGAFDFVWSWGVIHHSARTARIVREIARVLSPAGECRVMVYNRSSTTVALRFLEDYLATGAFLASSFEEMLYRKTDGFCARYYVREHFEDLFRAFFQQVESQVCGQEVDALPLPRQLRRRVRPLIPESYLRRAQARRGTFLFVVAGTPI
jgi:2-polyprenyl-3-methyl-5-hydroxy-6-metoxy-1,4-benzoquinol methylase